MNATNSRSEPEAMGKRLPAPTNRVLGSVDTGVLDQVVPELIAAGFAPIGILAGEAGLRRLRASSAAPGVRGFFDRFTLSTGGNLDIMRQAEEELAAGRAMIDVEVEEEEDKERARDVLLRHGGRFMTYMGRWGLEKLT